MSYDPESPQVGGNAAWEYWNTGRDDDAEADAEEARISAALERHRETTDAFFAIDTEADWVMVGATSGTIIESGKDESLLTEAQVSELEAKLGEELLVIGRPVVIEEGLSPASASDSRWAAFRARVQYRRLTRGAGDDGSPFLAQLRETGWPKTSQEITGTQFMTKERPLTAKEASNAIFDHFLTGDMDAARNALEREDMAAFYEATGMTPEQAESYIGAIRARNSIELPPGVSGD